MVLQKVVVKSWETEEKLQNISNEKKVKKVIKGLEKASKTHAKQAKILKSGLKVFKARRGGMDASQADFSSPSGSSSSGGISGPSAGDVAMGMGGKREQIQTSQEQVAVIKILHLKLQVQ